ncbi:MAG: hypoxanthine phosphoribosyltransferase [Candidatus Levybacteria bacterium]|nr:hypoxanthine phosphoribosyltransferase [Candidatus Levybacteria bacterium]
MKDNNLDTKILISQEIISKRINEIANKIAFDYQGKNVILLMVMKGSFIFMSDLIRALWISGLKNCKLDFVNISSYGDKVESSRNPQIKLSGDIDYLNKNILIVEDIVDSGHTIMILKDKLLKSLPSSLRVVSLLSKPARREVDVEIEYLGIEIKNVWVEGYGLDTDNKGRGRPDIIELNN